MNGQQVKGIVVGDADIERYIYIESLPDRRPDLREAWVDAKEFVEVPLIGGAALFARCLGWDYLGGRGPESDDGMKSLYLLTKTARNGESWEVGQAIVSGERQAEYQVVTLSESEEDKRPIALIDFRQGWVNSNRDNLCGLLQGRPYLVRTHDPTSAGVTGSSGKDLWHEVREQVAKPGMGIWFAPWQDLADGALRMAGNWHTVTNTIIEYFQSHGGDGLWKQYVVIQLGMDGLLILSPRYDSKSPEGYNTILTYPGHQPGSFERCPHATVVGGGILIAAALAKALLTPILTHKEVCDAAALGLARARMLAELGYSGPPGRAGCFPMPDENWNLYPEAAIAGANLKLPVPYEPPNDCITKARELLAASEEKFRRMVVFSLGGLYTCDERFAEQLIRLESRIKSHLDHGRGVLSVAVLGSPGSGKSFAAEEVLKSVGDPLEPITFNVSQFTSSEMLVDALKKVQTISLQGKVPFVFWDEFDCVHDRVVGGWLARFLMPMQEARFWDGVGMAQLGKCVFVFVGSTWANQEEFDQWVKAPERRGLKGRDFQSRLDRILEVPGIELPRKGAEAVGCPYLNRALVIRLALKGKGIKMIDDEVVDFLLNATYRHGMRSMKTIIEASQLGKTDRFSAYHLPPDEVLQVHVADTPGRPAAAGGSWLKLNW